MMNIEHFEKAIEVAFEMPFKEILKGRCDAVMIPRHLFISLLLEEGYKPKVVAKYLGKNPSTISASKTNAQLLLKYNRIYKDAYLTATKYLEDLD